MTTPRYVIDEAALRRNLEVLKGVADRTGAKILLAQKAFSCAAAYPLCARYLAGTTASSLFEARHGELWQGHTDHYCEVLAAGENLHGIMENVQISARDGKKLVGIIV